MSYYKRVAIGYEHKAQRAAVIGGGVIGLTTAAVLAQQGLAVRVFEAARFGGNASPAAGGILAPLHPWEHPDALIDLWLFSLERWHDLLARLRVRCRVRTAHDGVIYVDAEDQRAAVRWAQQRHARSAVLDRRTLCRLVPGLAAERAVLLENVMQVEVADVLDALLHYLRSQRVAFIHQAVRPMLDDQDVTGVCSTTERFAADVVIVCAGAWSAQVCALPPQRAVAPRRGQMIQYSGVAGAGRCVVAAGGQYLIPRSGGRLLAGSTVEDCGFDTRVTSAARAALATFAERLMPALKQVGVHKQWAGLRPWTPDALPLVCRHPEIPNLFLNTGHFRNGIGLAAGSAALVNAMVADLPPPLFTAGFGLPRGAIDATMRPSPA